MSQTIQQRMSAEVNGDVVVFLIGMRVNRWWKPHRYVPVATAMGRMLKELYAHPELGFLGCESFFGRTTMLIFYWKSTEHLLAYAKSRDAAHLPAWRDFNRRIGTNGDVGIWHETYRVRAGEYETVYANMPRFGLGKVGNLVPAHGPRESAAGRLGKAAPSDS